MSSLKRSSHRPSTRSLADGRELADLTIHDMTIEPESPPIGELLREQRIRRGMTQRQLADLSTVSVRTIRDLERGATSAPRPQTWRLIATVLRLDDTHLKLSPGSWAGRGPQPSGLQPTNLQPLLGRRRHLQRLIDIVDSGAHRLIALTGLPGAGKSRLAVELVDSMRDTGLEVLWHRSVDTDEYDWELPGESGDRRTTTALAGLHNAGRERAADPNILRAAIGPDALLVVLDGLQQQINGPLVLQLLRGCPRLRLLYTAPEPLRLPGELVVPVPPLPLPDMNSSSAQLQTNPALALLLRSSFEAGEMNDLPEMDTMSRICHQLGGHPLALRLAGPLMDLYGPEVLLLRLERDLHSTLNHHHCTQRWRGVAHRIQRIIHALAYPERSALAALLAQGTCSIDELSLATRLPPDSWSRGLEALYSRGLIRRTARGRFTAPHLLANFVPSVDQPIHQEVSSQ